MENNQYEKIKNIVKYITENSRNIDSKYVKEFFKFRKKQKDGKEKQQETKKEYNINKVKSNINKIYIGLPPMYILFIYMFFMKYF